MKQQFEEALNTIKAQNTDACIAGSAMLGYNEGWNQDIDVFCYNEQSFIELLYYMKYDKMFTILEPLEIHKMTEYLKERKSSLESIGLITIKFKWNLCIDVNIIYKKFQKNIFDCISAFDIDHIAQGFCLKTRQYLSLRTSTGLEGTWNRWNTSYYKSDLWSTKRLLRQFSRVVKYTERGYNLDEVTDKYISLIEDILAKDNVYKSEKGTIFYEKVQKEFEIVLKILQLWKKGKVMTPENLIVLQTLI